MSVTDNLAGITSSSSDLVWASPESACVTTVDAAFLNFLNRLELNPDVNPLAHQFSQVAHDFFDITPLNLEDANQMKGRVASEYTASALEALDVAEVCLTDEEFLAEAAGLIAVKFAQRSLTYRKLLEFSEADKGILTQLASNSYHDGQKVQESIDTGISKYPEGTPKTNAIRAESGRVIRFQLVDEELELTRVLKPTPERTSPTKRFRHRGFLPLLFR